MGSQTRIQGQEAWPSGKKMAWEAGDLGSFIVSHIPLFVQHTQGRCGMQGTVPAAGRE